MTTSKKKKDDNNSNIKRPVISFSLCHKSCVRLKTRRIQMAFTSLQNEESFSEKNLICPITNKIFQDPVLAGDGRVYERSAIVQWIQENGTSPITLEPISIDDLLPEPSVKQLCQREQMPVTYSTGNEEVTLSPLKVAQSPPIIAQPSIVATARQLIDNRKRSDFICFIGTLIVLAIIVFIIAIPLVTRSHSSGTICFVNRFQLSHCVEKTCPLFLPKGFIE
jgi:hypothetical protein